MSKLSTKLKRIGACEDAVEWSKGYDDDQVAWDACERGDWLLWVLSEREKSKPWTDDRKPLVKCCIEVALTVKHLWPKAQAANLDAAMKTMQKWCNGKATTEEANAATCAANAAATYAIYAASATYAATYAATCATCAANRKKTVKIVRKHFPNPPK